MRKKMMAAAATMVMSVAMAMVSLASIEYVSNGNGGWKFYFNDGSCVDSPNTGWSQEENGWKFYDEGTPLDYTLTAIDGKLYLFYDGYMKTGWFYGGYGSFNPVTGEQKSFSVGQQEWYYFLPDGSGATGWQQIENVWYYFGPDSIMYVSKTTPDGYFVDENGACTAEGQEFAREFDELVAKWDAEDAKTTEEKVQELIDLTNDEREKKGLAPLERNESLMEVAAVRAEELAEQFSHTRPNGTSCSSLLSEYGIPNRSGAENIVQVRNAAGAVNSWMKSSGHRKNMLNPNFTEIGVGYSKETNSWVQIFIGN